MRKSLILAFVGISFVLCILAITYMTGVRPDDRHKFVAPLLICFGCILGGVVFLFPSLPKSFSNISAVSLLVVFSLMLVAEILALMGVKSEWAILLGGLLGGIGIILRYQKTRRPKGPRRMMLVR